MSAKFFTTGLLICLVLQFTISKGQDILWGPANKGPIGLNHRDFVSSDQSSTIVLRCDDVAHLRAWNNLGVFYLERYNSSFQKELEVALKPTHNGKALRPETGIDFAGNAYIITSHGDQSAKRAYYYGHRLDKQTLKLVGEPIKIGEGYHNQFSNASYCKVIISDDKKLALLVTFNTYGDYSKTIGISVIDQDLKIKWSKTFNFPIASEDAHITGAFLDNQGNVFLKIAQHSFRCYERPPHQEEIYFLQSGLSEPMKLPIRVEGGVITKSAIAMDEEGRPIIVAFYSTDDGFVSPGYAYFRFNPQSLALDAHNTNKFSSEFLLKGFGSGISEKAKQKLLEGLKEYDLHSLIPMPGGKSLLLAERKMERQSTGSSLSNYYYYYESAALMFTEKGELLWAKKIPKRHASEEISGASTLFANEVTPPFCSFFAMRDGENILLLYNDAIVNLNKSIDDDVENYAFGENGPGTGIVKVVITPDGDVLKTILTTNSDPSTFAMPSYAYAVDSKTVLLCGKAYRNYVYGVLKL